MSASGQERINLGAGAWVTAGVRGGADSKQLKKIGEEECLYLRLGGT